ncbi:MAG TPA: MBL fold metallo-hydrolase [Geminicoccaceae bacterium]|nr:MBL fold metallo-hydrolase [Geminicoccus sp.]HMU48575.1 MBL fold metallo-hydrolase [Geminicoccaceae bacterium]
MGRGRGWTRRAMARAGLGLPLLALGGQQASAAGELPWHHLPGGGFRNPPGSPVSQASRGDWWSFMYRRLIAADPPVELPAGHVLGPRATLAGLDEVPGDSITWLGHACFLIRLGGLTLVTDPYLAEHASPLPPFGPKRFAPAPLAAADLPRIDIVLLSHNHYDHLDLPSLRTIGQRHRPAVVTGLGVSRYLDRGLFGTIYELDWYQRLDLGGAAITAAPAVHFSKRGFFDRNATLWCGFRIEAAGRSVHFTGDTTFAPVFAETGQRLGPAELALVPIGAYEPRALMVGSHCTPEEAVEIGRVLGARTMCGMHWGTIRLTDEQPFEPPVRFRAAMRAAGYPDDAAWVLALGETRAMPAAVS